MPENQSFDPKQVDWVDAPSTQPAGRPKVPKRGLRVAVAVLGSLVAISLFVIFIVSIVNNIGGRSAQVTPEMQDDIQRAIAKCQQTDDPEGCISLIAQELAQENGNGDYCMDLEGQPYIDCITLAAISSEDSSLCRRITEDDQARIDCNDAAVGRSQKQSASLAECENYMDADRIDQCERTWTRRAIQDSNCLSMGVDAELCSYGELIIEAQGKQDPDICDTISDDYYQGYCHQVTEPGDRDFDGLDEFTEADYGTSDRDSDTDGDGYSDYEEIQNGFDPLS